jgi:hypothetical protein
MMTMVKYTSYTVLSEYRVILTNFQGKIQVGDLIELNRRFISDPSYDASFDVIMDFSGSIAIGYKMDLLDYIEFFKKTIRLKNRVRVGIVYSSPNQNYLIGIYKPIASLLKMDVKDFKELDPCLGWMGYTEKVQQQIKASLESIRNTSLEINY